MAEERVRDVRVVFPYRQNRNLCLCGTVRVSVGSQSPQLQIPPLLLLRCSNQSCARLCERLEAEHNELKKPFLTSFLNQTHHGKHPQPPLLHHRRRGRKLYPGGKAPRSCSADALEATSLSPSSVMRFLRARPEAFRSRPGESAFTSAPKTSWRSTIRRGGKPRQRKDSRATSASPPRKPRRFEV